MDDLPDMTDQVLDGKYSLDHLIGQGGMGAVYRGRHQLTGRRVAVKFLLQANENMRQRFLNEAMAMGRLKHPNVIDIYDVGEYGKSTFIVMEYLDGRPLTSFLQQGGIAPADAIGLIMPALNGVAAAHQAGLLHRDLKPDNLFVLCDEEDEPFDTKVLDFGLAKAAEETAHNLTMSGALVGTPRYMSPEQVQEGEVDARSDEFALGLILFELLTGRLPYKSTTLNALLLEIITTEYPYAHDVQPSVPRELAEVVHRAMERESEQRYPDIASMARALEPWGGGVTFTKPRKSRTTAWKLEAPSGPGLTPSAQVVVGSGDKVDSMSHTQAVPSAPRPEPETAPEPAPTGQTSAVVLPTRGPSGLVWAGLAMLLLLVSGAVGLAWTFASSSSDESAGAETTPPLGPAAGVEPGDDDEAPVAGPAGGEPQLPPGVDPPVAASTAAPIPAQRPTEPPAPQPVAPAPATNPSEPPAPTPHGRRRREPVPVPTVRQFGAGSTPAPPRRPPASADQPIDPFSM